MIISRTPYRISFFGGGTDFPEWYRSNGGRVLSTSIDKYCYISCRQLPPFFEHRYRLVYSKIECVSLLEEIQHPAVKAVLKEMGMHEGLEIHHDGDLPARSGIGSSSSFTVGMLNAILALQGKMASKRFLSTEAIRIEREVLKESVGCQDQIAAAYGGLNQIEFLNDDEFRVIPVVMPSERKKKLQNSCLLYFLGFQRTSSDIACETLKSFDAAQNTLNRMDSYVGEALSILCNPEVDLDNFGKLLDDNWKLKKSISKIISSTYIDEFYERALRAGALGGKLLGAGGGGFFLLYVPEDRREFVKQELGSLLRVDFEFESEGSKILVYEP